jgi:hypothetical protein
MGGRPLNLSFAHALLLMSLVLQIGAAQISTMVLTGKKMIWLDVAMLGLSTLLVILVLSLSHPLIFRFLIFALAVAPLLAVVGWWVSSSSSISDSLFTYPWWLVFLRISCIAMFTLVLIASL